MTGFRAGVLCLLWGFISLKSVNSACSGGRRNEPGPKAFLCYWGTWSFYKPDDAKFDVPDIDPFMCTHLIYSFAGLNNDTNVIESLDPWLDLPEGGGHGKIAETIQLREINPNLKILIAIGGWGQRSERFSAMAADPEKRATFIASVIEFIKLHDFDGLDMDWEYPGHYEQGGWPEDKENFVLLLKELREAFDVEEASGRDFWLTAAVGAGTTTIDNGYDVPGISEHLDCINIMAYDFKLYVENSSELIGHHSPLFAKSDENDGNRTLTASAAVEYFLELGAPPEKLALGIGAYGKTFDITSISGIPEFYDLASGPGAAFGFSQEQGTVAYYEMCYFLKHQNEMDGWSFKFDYDYYIPYAYNSSMWIGYDNEVSVIEKTEYALRQGLGGMMIWSIDMDDARNWCNGWIRNPIGQAIKGRLELID